MGKFYWFDRLHWLEVNSHWLDLETWRWAIWPTCATRTTWMWIMTDTQYCIGYNDPPANITPEWTTWCRSQHCVHLDWMTHAAKITGSTSIVTDGWFNPDKTRPPILLNTLLINPSTNMVHSCQNETNKASGTMEISNNRATTATIA